MMNRGGVCYKHRGPGSWRRCIPLGQRCWALLFLTATCIPALRIHLPGTAHIQLSNLGREFFSWRLEDNPEFASDVGVYRFNDRLEDFSLDMLPHRKFVAETHLHSLLTIPVDELSAKDKVNYAILKDMLQTYIDGYDWREWNFLNPLNLLEGNQRNPAYFVESTPFENRGDFENYIVRLQSMPRQFDEYIDLFNEAIRLGRTSNIVSVNRIPGQIARIISESVENSVYFSPFLDLLNNTNMNPEIQADIRERGRQAVQEVFKAYARLKRYMENKYFKHARMGWGVGTLPQGREYYQACLRWYLSLNMSPEEVHQLGLNEVARIEAQMKRIMVKQGFAGYTVAEYFAELKKSKKFFLPTSEAMLEEYEVIIEDRIEPTLKGLFKDHPGLPLRVDPMPSDGPRGQYSSGTADGSRPGVFYANVLRPDETPTYLMMSLTLHETNPGHHLQMSYAMTADLPDFRKNKEYTPKFRVPFAFPTYTAYVEGWALYAEQLGEELNLFQDDYELMGYYDSALFRACRLVIDTGIHYYNWTRDQAIEYFLNYTTDSRAGVEVEVDRYITWPGQACAYTIGQLKITELRSVAEEKLKDHFDIRDFHSVVLENGPVPLRILESLVNNWIENHHKNDPKPNDNDTSIGSSDCMCPPNAVVSSRCPASGSSGQANSHSVPAVLALSVLAVVIYFSSMMPDCFSY